MRCTSTAQRRSGIGTNGAVSPPIPRDVCIGHDGGTITTPVREHRNERIPCVTIAI